VAGARYGVETVEIPPGSLLCLYTDGMPEAARAGGPEYGEKRLHAALASSTGRPALETMATLRKDLDEFMGGEALADDTTILMVRRTR
jgi:serine phosphatase RsbU (regulator of sigma subunit)